MWNWLKSKSTRMSERRVALIEQLREKGWKKSHINKTVRIIEKAKKDQVPAHVIEKAIEKAGFYCSHIIFDMAF